MNTKAKGSRNELQCKRFFEADGSGALVKAGASLGLFDLVGFWRGKAVAIQVKSNRRIPRKERVEIEAFMERDPPLAPRNLLVLEAVKKDYKGWAFWRYDAMSGQWIPWGGLDGDK